MMSKRNARRTGGTVIENLWYKNAVTDNLLETFVSANGDGHFEGLATSRRSRNRPKAAASAC